LRKIVFPVAISVGPEHAIRFGEQGGTKKGGPENRTAFLFKKQR